MSLKSMESGKWQVASGKWQVGEPSDGTNFVGNEILNHSLGFAGKWQLLINYSYRLDRDHAGVFQEAHCEPVIVLSIVICCY